MLSGSASQAQTAPTAPGGPATRWAVGLQAAAYPRIAFVNAYAGQSQAAYVRPWPVMPTLSYRLEARGALEAGLLLRLSPTHTTSEVNSTGTYLTTSHASTWMVPFVVRAQLAPQRAERWQLDAVLGVMPLSTKYTEENTFVDVRTGQASSYGDSRQAYSDLPLLAGIGGAYALTPHLSLTADARFAWSILGTIVGRALSQRDDFVAPIWPALSAGLSYQFGKPLP
ncbi:hypothetical protein Q3A66_10895 [Hymenobacter sp. BT770]|uniref:hypothetical protein n=1 Tax=Hymenobacter sp. BT770 TaxID=2886942 RepID=UPI001D1148E7|nr:hypothetical protein [Hymenobacter sp. BT770]MCC3153342.1 hypothetical protein [Hymenobacter sp. BT770]MDO3415576.1 hypothetical protein [Hymenobacter sp. BT770]